MDLLHVQHYFNTLTDDGLSFFYQGDFLDDVTAQIMELQDRPEDSTTGKLPTRRKVNFLIAECFQNVIRHADTPEIVNATNNKPSMFMIRQLGGDYYVASANLIDRLKVDMLEKHLDNINTLSQESLRQLYTEVLANQEFSSKGGAGLGLIEMARKTKEKYDYHFEFINFYHSLFYILIKLKQANATNSSNLLHLRDIQPFYHNLIKENILVMHKGDFSQHSVLPILGMMEQNLPQDAEGRSLQKKVGYMLIELLQNMSKHGLAETNGHRKGLFMIGYQDDAYLVGTGNYVASSEVDALKNRLDGLAAMDAAALTAHYKYCLVHNPVGEKGSAGLGLIDIARICNNHVTYSFKPTAPDRAFFSMMIKIKRNG